MAVQDSDLFQLDDVPEVNFPVVGAESELVAFGGPADGGDSVGQAEVTQLGDLRVVGIPEVDIGGKADCQEVLRTPIDEIEVKVVLQSWCIQNLERNLVELPLHLDRPYQFRREVELLMAGLSLRDSCPASYCEGFLAVVLERVVILEGSERSVDLDGLLGRVHDTLFVDFSQGQRRGVCLWRSVLAVGGVGRLGDWAGVFEMLAGRDEPVGYGGLL